MRPSGWSYNPLIDFPENLFSAIDSAKAILFCGAGISVNSGLPTARQLLWEIGEKLPLSKRAMEIILRSPYPFEAFMEVLRSNTKIDALLNIFSRGEPCTTHRLIAKLAAANKLSVICTTNFDTLIESALEQEGLARSVDYEVYFELPALRKADLSSAMVKVLKLHGSIEEPASVMFTINHVASGTLRPALRAVLTKVFARGSQEVVAVLGYSFSDLFDILPTIRSIKAIRKSILAVDHTPAAMPHHAGFRLEPLNADLFSNAQCALRARLDTDQLVEFLWTRCLATPFQQSGHPPVWRADVEAWADNWKRASPASGFKVSGELLEATSNFRQALGYLRQGAKVARDNHEGAMEAMLLSAVGRVNNSVGLYKRGA
jgi:hypothetical protein